MPVAGLSTEPRIGGCTSAPLSGGSVGRHVTSGITYEPPIGLCSTDSGAFGRFGSEQPDGNANKVPPARNAAIVFRARR
jgi:hypothetical protein